MAVPQCIRINHIGQTYGFLTVIDYDRQVGKRHYWTCRCVCGMVLSRRSDQLHRFKHPSCGCNGKPVLPDGMKLCPRCNIIQDSSCFNVSNSRNDGLEPYCKICKHDMRMRYYATDEGKQTQRRARRSLSYKAYVRRRSRTENEKKRNRDRMKSAQGVASRKRYYERNFQKQRARRILYDAISSGRIPRSKECVCHHCGDKAQEYHHWHGYSDEHALDVIALCRKCHIKDTYPDAPSDEEIFRLHSEQQNARLSKSLGKRRQPAPASASADSRDDSSTQAKSG